MFRTVNAPLLLRNINELDISVAISSRFHKLLDRDVIRVWPAHQRGMGSGVVRCHDGLDTLLLYLIDFVEQIRFEPKIGISLQRLGSPYGLSIQVLVHSSTRKDRVIIGKIASKESLAITVVLAWRWCMGK